MTHIRRYATMGILLALATSGCMNMPTPAAQITGVYTSGLNYKDFGCEALVAEEAALARRENALIIAQEQRVKSSQIQAFFWGFGAGDGIEASELANVRGQKESVRVAIEANSDCMSRARSR